MWYLNDPQTVAAEYRKQVERELAHARLVRLAEQGQSRQPVLAPVARWTGVHLMRLGARLQDYACDCRALSSVQQEAPAVLRD